MNADWHGKTLRTLPPDTVDDVPWSVDRVDQWLYRVSLVAIPVLILILYWRTS